MSRETETETEFSRRWASQWYDHQFADTAHFDPEERDRFVELAVTRTEEFGPDFSLRSLFDTMERS